MYDDAKAMRSELMHECIRALRRAARHDLRGRPALAQMQREKAARLFHDAATGG